MNKFGQFKTFNLKACIDRADDLLTAIAEMHLSNEDAKALCDAQMLTSREGGDVWESLAWQMAYVEIFERQIRVEDEQCEKPPMNWNGGFLI